MPLIHPWMAPDLCERGPNVQQQRAVDRIEEQHGGVLPSDLYNQTLGVQGIFAERRMDEKMS